MSGFGKFKQIAGKAGVFKASELPLELIMQIARNQPIPITIGGTSDRTFTLNASTSKPVILWNGNDVISLKESLAYSWVVGTNNILDSTGAETTLTNSTTGVWYYYVGLDADGTIEILPSATAPAGTQGPFENGILTHPGTSKAKFWNYVGFHICDATTPTFVAAEKSGFWYEFAAQSVATTTTWAALDFSAVLPKHGVECAGYLETSTTDNDTTEVGTSSTDGRGAYVCKNSAASDTYFPFGPLTVDSNGQFYGSSTTAAGDVHVTRVRDVV